MYCTSASRDAPHTLAVLLECMAQPLKLRMSHSVLECCYNTITMNIRNQNFVIMGRKYGK
jgi:hypothetical protein